MAATNAPPSARRALEALGENIRSARLKRRISFKGFAERIGVSERTVIRLEKGDNGVSIGTLAMACLVLGEIDRIAGFLDSGSDDTGLLMDREALPKRIDRKRANRPEGDAASTSTSDSDSDEGVGF